MSLFGKFEAYCNNCGRKVITEAGCSGMWGRNWRVCGETCHEEMSKKDTRSILGKHTLSKEEKEELR